MKEEKTITQNKKTKTFKTVEPGVETAFLTSKNIPAESSGKLELTKKNNHYFTPPIQYLTPTPEIQLLQENITKWLNQMDICFKLILGVSIYFLWHFMAAHLLPFDYRIISSCFGICVLGIAWKCFFTNKNATLDEIKKFFEKHSNPK
jgi:hypothetical protein